MSYLNRVYNTTTNKFVAWRSISPDTSGTLYPGPGTFGVNTSGFTSNLFDPARSGVSRLITGSTTSTLAITDWFVEIDNSGGNHTMTLCSLASSPGEFVIQKVSTGTNTITFALAASDTTAKIYFLGNTPSAGASLTLSDSNSVFTPMYTVVPDVTNNCWRIG